MCIYYILVNLNSNKIGRGLSKQYNIDHNDYCPFDFMVQMPGLM